VLGSFTDCRSRRSGGAFAGGRAGKSLANPIAKVAHRVNERRIADPLALSMESWGLRPGKQFALSSATMGIEVVVSSPAINQAKF